MKKILLYTYVLGLAALTSCTSETYNNSAETLPLEAQQYLSDYFESAVSVVKVDKNLVGSVEEYEVTLEDGTQLKFNGEGLPIESEAARGATLPSGVVPDSVRNYLDEQHPGLGVTQIERVRNGYEIKLTNGVEMKFATDGTLLDYDD